MIIKDSQDSKQKKISDIADMLKTCCDSERWIKVPIFRTKTVVVNKEMIPTTCRQFILSIKEMFPAQNGQMK